MTSCPLISFQGGTSGIDEALQGLSSDPYASSQASSVGLRVPTFKNGPRNRFTFLLATRQLNGRTHIRGLRQLLTIGSSAPIVLAEGLSPVERPVELQVTTPHWHFPDGNVSWHLVVEPNTRTQLQLPNTNTGSSARGEADGPAFLYETATWAAAVTNPATGAPLNYNVGLTSYTPPGRIPAQWQALGGLGCFYDYRFPWVTGSGHTTLNIPVEDYTNHRISFYATILQTAGGGPKATTGGGTAGWPPEELFLSNTWLNGVYYWRVAGDILFDDEDAWCNDAPERHGNVIPIPRRRGC